MKTILFNIILIFAMCIQSNAQQYYIKSYSSENGLPTNIITGVCQDQEGYMWFSTFIGLSRYDGFEFKNYDTTLGLKNSGYRKILCDEKGKIWAMPYIYSGSIAYLENGKWKNLPPAPKRSINYLTSFDVIYKDNNPIVCVGGYSGIDIFENNKWNHIEISKEKEKNKAFNVRAHENVFYVSTALGVCIIENNKPTWSLNKKINKTNEAIFAINFERKKQIGNNKMWILTNHTFGYYQNNEVKIIAQNFFLDDIDLANIPYITSDSKENIIFGNNFFKYYLDISSNTITPLRVKNGFSSNGASAVFVDKEGNIWFTDSRGIDKISNIDLVNYYTSSGLPENEVTAICEAPDGRMIFGHNNQISILHNNKFLTIEFPATTNSLTRVLDITCSKSGNIWITANNLGVGKLSLDNKIHWYNIPEGYRATSIYEDNIGNLWIGTNKEMLTFRNNKIEKYKYAGLIKANVRKIFPTEKGVVLATMNGLWLANLDTAYLITPKSSSSQINSFSYLKDNDNNELVGTMNGIFILKKGKLTPFYINGKAITNPVYFIKKDFNNNYWIGTNNGVIRWDGRSDAELFTNKSGLAGRETNRSAGFLDSKGNFWVGTDRGLSCFKASDKYLKAKPPSVQLLFIETPDGKKYPMNRKCQIENAENSLSFHFRGISFLNEELITYRYKLEGIDNDWRDANQLILDKIKYNSLKPGTYRLIVSARNYSSGWSKPVVSAEIVIKYPFYLSWWFIAIGIILLLGLLLIFHTISREKIINKTLKKEISERKQAETNLIESEERLSFVLEGSYLGTWDWDLEKKIVRRNHIWAEMIGYKIEEILPTEEFWLNLIHPDDLQTVKRALKEHLEGNTETYETKYRILTKSKTYKWIHDRATVTERNEKGEPKRMSGTHTDIDQAKRAEIALQQSEERLRLLLVSLPVAIYVSPVNSEIDLNIITGNIKTLLGYTEDECLSSPDFWRKRIHPDDYERVAAEYKNAYQKTELVLEYRWLTGQGEYKWFHDQSIIKTYGSQKEFLGVLIDINDRKLAEQEIHQKNNELHYINAEKDKLFSIISHDLRSPVNGFIGLTNLLFEEINNLDREQIFEIAKSLQNSASKVGDLLNDLLEWSRLQRGLTQFDLQNINLFEVSNDCVNILQETAKQKNIAIKNEIPGVVFVSADIYMLKLIIRNLLSNSIKFTHQNGTITLRQEQKDNSVIVSITDNGIGMSEELISRLFKINEKTSRKGTDGEPSSGLGLLLCKEFVEKHGGVLWVDSKVNEGSTFFFSLIQEKL